MNSGGSGYLPYSRNRPMTAVSWGQSRSLLGPEVSQPLPPIGPVQDQPGTLLGAGRSGRVYRLSGPGEGVARKIFFGDAITHTLHYLFFGAPNPYIWNPDAVASAYYRRKILASLVEVWFGDRLAVSQALAMGWDAASQAYFLDTEFVSGRPVALCQPFHHDGDRELPQQVHNIMQPLQRHLERAGFDGLLWQVGKGNPSALNNLLLTDATTTVCHYAWIDLESGVPALFPLNPLTLFTLYLPQALRRGQAMFDDVDIPQLQRYLADRGPWLIESLGPSTYTSLLDDVRRLAYHQSRWKTQGRIAGSVQYQLVKGRMTEAEAEAALANPWGWYSRELGRLIVEGSRSLGQLSRRVWLKLMTLNYPKVWRVFWLSCLSHRYRQGLARRYVVHRIQVWHARGQLTAEEADLLTHWLSEDHSSDYLSDFCVHLAIKLPAKVLRFTLLPILYGFGLIHGWTLAILLAGGGVIVRQIYTLARMVEAAYKQQPIPWIAFWAGFVPLVSNVAYACQMIYSATRRQRDKVAQFIIYDSFTRIGTAIPAWGGPDTLVEHWFNRAADRIIQGLRRFRRPSSP
jgi:hypothetical protein